MRTDNTHKKLHRPILWVGSTLVLTTLFLTILFSTLNTGKVAAGPSTGFGYGFNVSAWDINLLQSMGFNWMKVFNGPGNRLPVNVLLRVEANADHLNDLSGFSDSMRQLAQEQKGFVDAYEIGNEPNLDADFGWKVAPNAADYVTVLCEAYSEIKAVDPDVVIVSAGLAPTGRVSGNWNGHSGHNGFFQDEREFFKEFLAAGGGNCLDVVGYHPYGFSADYDAEPDLPSSDPTQNCSNGFCFRGTEKIFELMQANGLENKKVWATEYGWIVQPPSHCLAEPGWSGRQWQIVSETKQASNLVGSFDYAIANWPWMEAMFIFNLNFNENSGLDECEQMRYYGVQGRPAESALRDMPKVTKPLVGELSFNPKSIPMMITADQQPFSRTIPVDIENIGTLSFAFTMTVEATTLTPTLIHATGTLTPTMQTKTQVMINSTGQPTGTYTATLSITATEGTVGVPASIPVALYIVDEIHSAFLPVITRRE